MILGEYVDLTIDRSNEFFFGRKGNIKFSLSKSVLGCLAFLMIFPLDTIAQIVENSTSFILPIGMLGILLSAFISVFAFFETGLALIGILAGFLLTLIFESIILGSDYGDFVGFYTFAKAFFVFCVGYYFAAFIIFCDRDRFQNYFLLLFSIIFFLAFFGTLSGLNYLRLADGFVLLAFVIISRFKSQFFVIAMALASVIALYSIGARFALLGFTFSVSFLVWSRLSKVKRLVYPVFSIVTIIFFYYLGGYYFSTNVAMQTNRFLRLVYDSESDGSFTERVSQFLIAKDVIVDNVLFGKYKYYEADGLVGAYAHNFVSYWAEFGVFGFFYSLGLVLLSVFVLYFRAKFHRFWVFDFVFIVNIYFLSGLVIAKSYHWLVIYFVVGVNIFLVANSCPVIKKRFSVSCKEK